MCLCQLDDTLKDPTSRGGGEASLDTTAWLAHVTGLQQDSDLLPSGIYMYSTNRNSCTSVFFSRQQKGLIGSRWGDDVCGTLVQLAYYHHCMLVIRPTL